MSSRLIPPNAGAIFTTVRMISSVSWVSRQIGTALTPPHTNIQSNPTQLLLYLTEVPCLDLAI